jgi:signal transduction histidine kinase
MFEDGGRFAGCVAHELRTPLATQRALLELALADPYMDVAGWREIGEDVLRACRQQERLLDACLALARSEGGLRRRERVDLAAIAAEALGAHDLGRLESVVVLEPAWTTGDPDLLERLVANLVSNAIRHNVARGAIEVATRAASGSAVLSVANTGPLIPAGELQRLFEPFQRLDSSLSTSGDGVGLGLPIVQAIAEAHSAFMTARARAGGGLEIDVSFRRSLPEREHVRLDAGSEEGDLERAIVDRSPPADQLIEPLVGQCSMTVPVDVDAVVVAGRLSVDKHAER